MRGLGLSWLWVLAGTSDADDRCPTQLVYSCLASQKINLMDKQNDKQPSSELQAFMLINKIESIAELLSFTDEVLIEMPGFGWHLLKEILLFRKVK
jgi:hypothetical protein